MDKLPVSSQKNNLPARRQDIVRLDEIVSAFESETADMIQRTSPKSERITFYILCLMLVVAVGLAAVVKLDRVVTGGGVLVSSGGSLYVSPLNAGVVREVKVKVGDVVKKGQVLATLDPTLTQADVTQLQQKLDSDAATIARLEAEQNGTVYVPDAKNSFSEVQASLWRQRKAEYASSLASFDAQIANSEAVVAQYQRDAVQYKKRMALASDVQDMYEPLVRKGYVSRQQYNSATDSKEEISRLFSVAENQIAAQRQAVAAVKAQRAAYLQKWRSDAGTQLVAVRDAYNATKENLEKANKLLELATITSPADAIVLKIGKISTGSIAQSTTMFSDASTAGALFTLVPVDVPLEAEVNVPAQDVGFIRRGDKVNIKIDAYLFIRHGTASGLVKTISEGSFTVNENNQPVSPYFKVRIAIKEANLHDVPADFRLIPGMTVSGDVLVGSRTILSYLLEGALRTGSEAMREVQ